MRRLEAKGEVATYRRQLLSTYDRVDYSSPRSSDSSRLLLHTAPAVCHNGAVNHPEQAAQMACAKAQGVITGRRQPCISLDPGTESSP